MISKHAGKVNSIIKEFDDIQEIEVEIAGSLSKAYNYNLLTGKCKIGDRLILNTTAVELSLGTGGYHYVVANIDNSESVQDKDGHMMKLRYTPFQIKVNMVEEDECYRSYFENFTSLNNLPVVSGNLHSMLAPFVASLKLIKPKANIVYIMTDGAALPAWFSRNIKNLKEKSLISNVITIGNAFGGDYECMNIYSALVCAKEILKADIVYVGMGPGIAGTGTKYGFSGIEQAGIIDAINTLGGMAICIPRISFADKRDRHYGISHHSLTVLSEITNSSAVIPLIVPLDKDKAKVLNDQIKNYKIDSLHKIVKIEETFTQDALNKFALRVKTMGRNYDQDSEFFDSAAASGIYSAELL